MSKPLQAMDETARQETIRQAQAGSVEAWAELYRMYLRRVYGLCRNLLGSSEAAEDATTEVFLRVYRGLKQYDTSLPFTRWLLSIASHYCVDQLRRRQKEAKLFVTEDATEVEVGDTTASPLEKLLAHEKHEEVRAAVLALPSQYRVPLALRYYEGLSYAEIGRRLGLKRNHVATLLFRAKKQLRQGLKRKENRR